MSFAVTLHDSSVSDLSFLSGFRCCNPALVMREFDTLSDTSDVSPVPKWTIIVVMKIKYKNDLQLKELHTIDNMMPLVYR